MVPFKHNGKIVELVCYDFAGQEEYYETHQLFITENSLFVLVIDASGDYNDDGMTDIAVASNAKNTIEIYLQRRVFP